ncbi:hypothetical protein RRG08_044062 [Elysia crispata]|uniref:Uncharacterized protein n=1 Tax=Elysia crispata TaxID=231223 RepID=A0AAE1CR55_9GAST|nr:hypothetical protein RRG08_044062 [Elysia crispata]
MSTSALPESIEFFCHKFDLAEDRLALHQLELRRRPSGSQFFFYQMLIKMRLQQIIGEEPLEKDRNVSLLAACLESETCVCGHQVKEERLAANGRGRELDTAQSSIHKARQ